MSSKPELGIWSHDTGQQIPCFDSCLLTTTWIFNIICMIKLRLHDLALGGVWQPCSTELVSIHTTNHVCHEKRVVWFSISMHAYGCFYSYRALICDSHRVLLENNNILTWLQSFQVKIENFFKFLLSL